MKKILIFSDTHGAIKKACDIIASTNDVDYIIHAGDISRDAEEIKECFENIPIIYVSGNCDWGSSPAEETVVEIIEGKKIFVTHGHKYNVKNEIMLSSLKDGGDGCDLIVFGHTHKPYIEYGSPYTIVNPGSITYGGTYAVCKIENGNITVEILDA